MYTIHCTVHVHVHVYTLCMNVYKYTVHVHVAKYISVFIRTCIAGRKMLTKASCWGRSSSWASRRDTRNPWTRLKVIKEIALFSIVRTLYMYIHVYVSGCDFHGNY